MNPTVECPKCKRRIALGRAACTFCGAALPASEAPAPAPAGPKRYEIGDRVEVAIAPGDPGRGPIRLRFKGVKLVTPPACACCLGPAQGSRPVTASNIRTLPGEMMSNKYQVETRTYTIAIPYCAHCLKHAEGTLRQPSCVGTTGVVALSFFFDKRELELTCLNREFGLKVLELNGRTGTPGAGKTP